MTSNLHAKALQWVKQDASAAQRVLPEFYCQTRDTFQARVDTMTQQLLHAQGEDLAYIISAMVGEIGSNSFDHNTLQRVRPTLQNDAEALEVAFNFFSIEF